jgi:hypothetical protein
MNMRMMMMTVLMMITSAFGQLGLCAPFHGCETYSHQSRIYINCRLLVHTESAASFEALRAKAGEGIIRQMEPALPA